MDRGVHQREARAFARSGRPRVARALLILALVALPWTGCASTDPFGQHRRPYPGGAAFPAPAPNLALGPSVHTLRVAQQIGPRSAWPSADAGYELMSISAAYRSFYDNQSFYTGRFGGYHDFHESYDTRVILR